MSCMKMEMEELNKTLDKNLSLNKWELLYRYALESLDQDVERFHRLDDKISKFITLVTVIMSVFVAAIPFVFKHHFPPKSFLEYLLMILLFLTFITLCSLWSFLFRGLRLQDVPRMPFNEKTLTFFKDNKNVNTIMFALTRTCLNAFEKHKEINANKVWHLNKAYDDTVWAASLIIVDLFLIVLLQVMK